MSNIDDVDSNFVSSEREHVLFYSPQLLKKHVEVVAKKGGYLSSFGEFATCRSGTKYLFRSS